ncbi:box C/D snoRNA protein 1 isoform X2 [Lethenteron reissneri]|uniref:box C/D snoRNA protein 1 isoform X2 n=1 Tax=Lethenteron reissneri TaxID=7753 RepID=UPI002AB75DE2|nr:box C/D snoRNA protein 1 isoform X2 [Lethenteron reissneri]
MAAPISYHAEQNEGCEVCAEALAKYRCPCCLLRSCSVACVQAHKTQRHCSGVRNKTIYVPLGTFSEGHLLSDYRFLEDVGRAVENSTRDAVMHGYGHRKTVSVLRNYARRDGVDLRMLPAGLQRHRDNFSFFHKREKSFFWTVKLIFPQSRAEFTERRVAGSQSLADLLTRYVGTDHVEPVTRQRLREYNREHARSVRLFMKEECQPANAARYHEFLADLSLQENLRGKTIVEYPVLHVVIASHVHAYPTLSDASGDIKTEEAEVESGKIQVDTE